MPRRTDPDGNTAVREPDLNRCLFDGCGDALFVFDEGGRCLDANATALERYGYTLDEVRGLTKLDFHPKEDQQELATPILEHHGGHVMSHHVTKSGELLEVEIVASDIEYDGRPARLVSCRDVTGRDIADVVLTQQREMLRRVVQHAPVILFSLDSTDHLDLVEGRGLDALDVMPDTLKGMRYQELFGESDELERAVELAHAGQETRCHVEVRGRTHEVRLHPSPNPGTGVIGVSVDQTDRVKAERELESARDSALNATKAKSSFLASMSHELRTPLNGVVAMADLLLDTELATEQEEMARTVATSANDLLSIVNDILDLSQVEAGKMRLNLSEIDVEEQLAKVLEALAPQADKKDLELILRVPGDLPRSLMGDPDRFRQIVLNFAGNAVKFTESGHVCVTARCRKLSTDRVRLRIEIEDTGPGLEPEVMERIFDRFEQASNDTHRVHGGTGLGLAICKQIAGLMGGEVGGASQPGRGSCFWLEVEFEIANALPRALPESVQGARVLAAIGHELQRQATYERLTALGLRAEVAPDWRTALRVLANGMGEDDPFRFFITDTALRGSPGTRQVAAVVTQPWCRDLVLLPLARLGVRLRPQELGRGCRTWPLWKPLRTDQLAEAVVNTSRKADASHANQGAPRPMYAARALVVDDNVQNQRVAQRLLEKLGCKVDVVSNGEKALEALDQNQHDIVFMDWHMPVMDGLEATREYRRRQGVRRGVPIIALTANAMGDSTKRCMAAGMDGFLSKPTTINDFQAVLDEWVPAQR